uniref:Uncharacterized protein n=1 Tax=Aegilops tauschii subsp. strangulata TaxID=200361 RepID=A0A453QPE8_AEGTS
MQIGITIANFYVPSPSPSPSRSAPASPPSPSPSPRGGLLPQPTRARPQRAGGADPAEDTARRRGARAGDRRRRLPVRVRAVVRARVHLRDPHLHAAGLHRLLRVHAVVLGLHVSSDRPAGVSKGQYWLGFLLTLAAAALYGLVLPLIELTYKRAAGGGRVVTYALVMEMQLVMGFFATAFCTVGMIVNNDFQKARRCGGWARAGVAPAFSAAT